MILWIVGAVVLLIISGISAVYWYLEPLRKTVPIHWNWFWLDPIGTLRLAKEVRKQIELLTDEERAMWDLTGYLIFKIGYRKRS